MQYCKKKNKKKKRKEEEDSEKACKEEEEEKVCNEELFSPFTGKRYTPEDRWPVACVCVAVLKMRKLNSSRYPGDGLGKAKAPSNKIQKQ